MHIRKYLSIFLIGLVFAIAGCSGSSSSGGSSDAELLPDTDGDGIVNDLDFDIDGDGTLNKDDADDDGDGTPDATDPTPNGGSGGSGDIEVTPPTPGLVCTSAQIIAPDGDNDALPTGSRVKVGWDLLPAGCGVQGGATGMATATAEEVIKVSLPVSPGAAHVLVRIPHKCSWDGTQDVTYSISQIGTALGDPSADSSHDYKQTIKHPVKDCSHPAAIADSNIVRLSTIESCTQDPQSSAVTCEGDSTYWVYKKMSGPAKELSETPKPTWNTTPQGVMSVWLDSNASKACVKALKAEDWSTDSLGGDVYCPAKRDGKLDEDCDHVYKKARINYKGLASHGVWNRLAAKGCKVATSFEGCPNKDTYKNCPKLGSFGNFIVETSGTTFTVRSYSPGN